MRTLALFALCCTACAHTEVEVLPTLTPIDPSRPFFVYPAIKGTACGPEATPRALDDLFRVAASADGFITAVIERTGDKEPCVTITARPISYGCDENAPTRLDEGKPMHVEPGPRECGAPPDACTPECQRFSTALQGSEFESKAVRERCMTRCRSNDLDFMNCAHAAVTPAAVKQCDATTH